jgi:hypothetical protein
MFADIFVHLLGGITLAEPLDEQGYEYFRGCINFLRIASRRT